MYTSQKHLLFVEGRATDQIDGNQNTAAENRKHHKHISYHPQEPEKDDRIESDLFDKVLVLDVLDSSKPTEWFATKGYRCMFLIGMFRSRGIYAGITWPEPTEDEKQATRNREGPYYSCEDGILLDL